ncbi:hypothetical protein [Streptomyces spectabilis]|uniref:Uncharacterized protein n=1 Tax=Streptomyces spectabilis TaxID=68270 RepID=A0A7W8B425_STRST|nr:hypothetical protein [Streptomyces spectabilis]GGV52424.1 hypothetical protein GCM10010245_82550 [Streptomyces spectabilis]
MIATAFAVHLKTLYQQAGEPTYALLIRQGQQQKPPVKLTNSSIGDWLTGRSTRNDGSPIRISVMFPRPSGGFRARRGCSEAAGHVRGGSPVDARGGGVGPVVVLAGQTPVQHQRAVDLFDHPPLAEHEHINFSISYVSNDQNLADGLGPLHDPDAT